MKNRKLFILAMLVLLSSPVFSQGPDDPSEGDPDAIPIIGKIEVLIGIGLIYGVGKLIQKSLIT